MPDLRLPQGTISYADEGDPTGAPVVCVHGLLAGRDLWATTAQALGDRARTIRLDLPLGSHPRALGRKVTPADVARLLLDALDALALDDPVLMGNDTGGALCQLAIAADPQRVRRLVLTNCDAFTEFPPGVFALLRPAAKVPGLMTALTQPARIPALRHHALYGLLASERDDALWASWAAPYLNDAAVRREANGFMRTIRPAELDAATRSLATWGGRAKLVWGMRDRFFTPELGRRLAATLQAEFVEVPEAKTFVPLDAPQRLADEVAAFLTSPAPTPAPATG